MKLSRLRNCQSNEISVTMTTDYFSSRLTRLKIIQLVNWSTVDKLEVIDGISLAKLRVGVIR